MTGSPEPVSVSKRLIVGEEPKSTVTSVSAGSVVGIEKSELSRIEKANPSGGLESRSVRSTDKTERSPGRELLIELVVEEIRVRQRDARGEIAGGVVNRSRGPWSGRSSSEVEAGSPDVALPVPVN